jgi:uncharacterized protein YkwD
MLCSRRIPAVVFAMLVTALAGASPAGASRAACAGADAEPTASTLSAAKAATVCLLNAERRQRRLRPLVGNHSLDVAAARYSRRMVRLRFFDHVGPRGDTIVERLKAVGYLRGYAQFAVGENLAWGEESSGTPRQIVRAWMNSAGHRRNILNRRYREVGLGIALGSPVAGSGAPAATYTTAFGRVRRSAR